jgi:hypothetical protein
MMTRLLTLLIVLVVCIGALGFYQGWFSIGSTSSEGKSHITLEVDKEKIREDEKKAEDKAKDLEHRAKDKVSGPAAK